MHERHGKPYSLHKECTQETLSVPREEKKKIEIVIPMDIKPFVYSTVSHMKNYTHGFNEGIFSTTDNLQSKLYHNVRGNKHLCMAMFFYSAINIFIYSLTVQSVGLIFSFLFCKKKKKCALLGN